MARPFQSCVINGSIAFTQRFTTEQPVSPLFHRNCHCSKGQTRLTTAAALGQLCVSPGCCVLRCVRLRQLPGFVLQSAEHSSAPWCCRERSGGCCPALCTGQSVATAGLDSRWEHTSLLLSTPSPRACVTRQCH